MPVVHFRFASVDATLTSGTITVWSPRLRPGGTAAITGEKREALLVSGEASIDLEPGCWIRVQAWSGKWRWWDGGARNAWMSAVKFDNRLTNPGQDTVPDETKPDGE